MTLAIDLDPQALADACARFGVRRLRVFGSAASSRFDPATSDVDFLVDFQPGRAHRFDDYFGLREALEEATGRPVDLLSADAVRNPYVLASALATAEDVYAA